MKKAFEQNVSRAKPRLRLGALTGLIDPAAEPSAPAESDALADSESAPSAEAPEVSVEVHGGAELEVRVSS